MTKDQLSSFYMVIRTGLNELHSVHKDGCPFLPAENKRIYLGKFISLSDAIDEGNKYFSNNCGCRFCTHRPGEPIKKRHGNIDMGVMNFADSELLKYLN